MKIVIEGYKYRRSGIDFGRTLLRDCRKFWVYVGSYTLVVEFHGWGPTP